MPPKVAAVKVSGRPKDALSQSAKCPPGYGKRASGLPLRTAASEFAVDLQLAVASAPLLHAFDNVAVGRPVPAAPSVSTHPSGRAALAAYCLLRC